MREFGLRLSQRFFNEAMKVLANDRIGVLGYPELTLLKYSTIADLFGWVKERKATMRNDNLIVELLQSFSLMKCDR